MLEFLLRLLKRRAPERHSSLPSLDARFRQLFENLPDGVYESAPDGRILAANPALVSLLGYSSERELITAASAQDFYADPAERGHYTRELARHGRLVNAELTLIRKDGARITVLENASAVTGPGGSVRYYQGVLTDITARKLAEQELLAARDEALEASRLKSQFLANISHELRTPLNAVLGMARLMEGTTLPRNQREYLATIEESAHFLLTLINELLDYAKIEAGKLELHPAPFSLLQLLENCRHMLAERALAKGLPLTCEAAAGTPDWIIGDAERLRQVLSNLLSNAVRFTERGQIGLTVSAPEPGRLRFEVVDTGIGIPADAHEYIFEPFRQVDGTARRRYAGTGLGLAIAGQLVERMGGRIEVQSSPGAGSRFSFTLALREADTPASQPRSQPAGGQRHTSVPRKPRLLIAEDNLVNQKVLAKLVERLGYESDVVGSGREALSAVAARRYDAVLMDCQMPELDGFEATRALRRLQHPARALPVIAVTAHATADDRAACLASGMDAYISKPIILEELARVLNQWAEPGAKVLDRDDVVAFE